MNSIFKTHLATTASGRVINRLTPFSVMILVVLVLHTMGFAALAILSVSIKHAAIASVLGVAATMFNNYLSK